MRPNNTKLAQSALLLSALFLTRAAERHYRNPPHPYSAQWDRFLSDSSDNLCSSTPASCYNAPVSNKLIVAAANATTGEVTFNGVITPFTVAAGSQTVITLNPSVVLTANETVETKGIHVTALSPVSVHAITEHASSADGYLALPTAALAPSTT